MSVLDGFEAVGEKTTTNKMTMTVMESSVRFSKGDRSARMPGIREIAGE